jgi:glycosyltransferase involved in cell wall biosynthesis
MSDKPRIIFMSGDTVGDVWSYALELTRALAPFGIEVVLAALGGHASPAQREEAAAIANLTLFESPLRLEWMDDAWDDVTRAGDWLLELAARVRPDVVHLNHYAHGALAWPAPVLMVGHADVLSWHRAVRGQEASAAWDRYRLVVGNGLRAAAHVVAPTNAMLTSLAFDYGPLARAEAIAYGRDAAQFRPDENRAPLVVAAGSMCDEAKNLAALDAAAPRVRWPIVVAGAPVHVDGGGRGARQLHVLGGCDAWEMRELYARATVFALPARYEPFGLSILDAALSGCALVLGDIASLRESWDGAAQFVPPEDADALAAALERIVEDAALQRTLGRVAKERAATFSPARMAEAYLVVYRTLLSAAGEPLTAAPTAEAIV